MFVVFVTHYIESLQQFSSTARPAFSSSNGMAGTPSTNTSNMKHVGSWLSRIVSASPIAIVLKTFKATVKTLRTEPCVVCAQVW
jgi:hypothetical protein